MRDSDHAVMLATYAIDDEKKPPEQRKKASFEFDQRGLPSLSFLPTGKGVVYIVREKGVDNLWVQPLDATPRRQLTHFSSEKIAAYSFSKDGSRLALERGHAESDAVLLRNVSQ